MRKLIYVSSPFSSIEDKQLLMRAIAKISADYMLANPNEYAVTGLVNYYAVMENPKLGVDYTFWRDYCEMMISKSDAVLVLKFPGWETSIGVRGEIEYATALALPITYVDVQWPIVL